MNTLAITTLRCTALAAAAFLSACAGAPTAEAPRVDAAASTQALKNLPRKTGDLVPVSIYEFRSSVGEIAARGSTDMFKTALVQSGQFRVVERARLNEGVVHEKQLNASGLSSGTSASEVLIGAKYIFEGAITEANASETQRSGAIRIGTAPPLNRTPATPLTVAQSGAPAAPTSLQHRKLAVLPTRPL